MTFYKMIQELFVFCAKINYLHWRAELSDAIKMQLKISVGIYPQPYLSELEPNNPVFGYIFGDESTSNVELEVEQLFLNQPINSTSANFLSNTQNVANNNFLNDNVLESTVALSQNTTFSTPSRQSTPSPTQDQKRNQLERTASVLSNISDAGNESSSGTICVVCGDEGAKMHYGVMACLGCKGFFRRALKKADQYECLNSNQCVINKFERNSCRSCRLKKCLDVGMDPSAVRPDRDFTGKQHAIRLPNPRKAREKTSNTPEKNKPKVPDPDEDWVKKLPVEMRTTLMTLLNIETKVARGDTMKEATEIYPLGVKTIKEILEDPCKLKGRRTEMRYEPYRMAKNEELSVIVYRRLIAAIDWVEYLSELLDGLSIDDRIALVKNCFAPLLIFKCSSRTALVTQRDNLLCLCNFAYVPRDIANNKAYNDAYHLDNGLVEQCLTELVQPFRKIEIKEEEIVCISAIIVLNPMAKDLSDDGIEKISKLRNRVMDTFFTVIKETRPQMIPTSYFGNFLLYLPIVTRLANCVCENLRFAQTFSTLGSFPVLTSLFGCFPIEPFMEADNETDKKILKNVEVQTEPLANKKDRGQKRRLPSSFTSPVENDILIEQKDFRLLRPPCSYTLTEMFDDRMNAESLTPRGSLTPQPPIPQRQPLTASVSWSAMHQEQYYPVQTYQNQAYPYHPPQNHPHPEDICVTVTTAHYTVYPQTSQYYYQAQNSLPGTSHSNTTNTQMPILLQTPPIENLTFQHNCK